MYDRSLDNFEIYKVANAIGEAVWKVVGKWSYFQKDTMGKQLVRSADSIAANIAEGYGRFTYRERRLYCYYSRGSLIETKCWLSKALQRKLISENDYNKILNQIDILYIKLNKYIKSLNDKLKPK